MLPLHTHADVKGISRESIFKVLSENGIPVRVMMAPIIPSLNSHEILPLIKIR